MKNDNFANTLFLDYLNLNLIIIKKKKKNFIKIKLNYIKIIKNFKYKKNSNFY